MGSTRPSCPTCRSRKRASCRFRRRVRRPVKNHLIAPVGARVSQDREGRRGFVNVVSSLGVTGVRCEIVTDTAEMICLSRRRGTSRAPSRLRPLDAGAGTEIASVADRRHRPAAPVVKLVFRQITAWTRRPVRRYVREMEARGQRSLNQNMEGVAAMEIQRAETQDLDQQLEAQRLAYRTRRCWSTIY